CTPYDGYYPSYYAMDYW
nr:immunoglobulin heavy chain junction region [Mus musculus]